MAVIGVNDGHTIRGYGTGAVGRIIEGEHTRLVGAEVRRILKERGHTTVNCTIDYASSTEQSLALIVEQANRQDLDWFIAIHFNAGGGRGCEVYTYEGRQYEDAVKVCENISALGFRNRGVKAGTGLYVIRKTKAKSMLIEVCFVDTDDADKYLGIGHKVIAKAIVDALVGYISMPASSPQVKTSQLNVSGDLIKTLQSALNVQVAAKLAIDGWCGDATMAALVPVKKGAKGDLTYVIQRRLQDKGYGNYFSKWGADKSFGPATDTAVRAFQKDYGLAVDGSVGPITWKALLRK